MSNLIDAVGFSLNSLLDFAETTLAEKVLRRLLDNEAPLRPTTFGAYEPITQSITPRDLGSMTALWLGAFPNGRPDTGTSEGGILLACPSGVGYQVSWQKGSAPALPFVGGDVPLALLRGSPSVLESFLCLVKDLALIVDAAYGDIRNMSFPGWDLPFDLFKRLPDVPWGSLYGPPYISMFGRECIVTAPFHRIDEVGPSHLWLQASPSVLVPVDEETRARIRQHLGEEAFMSMGRWRYASGRAPRFFSGG